MPGVDRWVGGGSDLVSGGVPSMYWLGQWVCAFFQFVPGDDLVTW